jgi:hypothetical protein
MKVGDRVRMLTSIHQNLNKGDFSIITFVYKNGEDCRVKLPPNYSYKDIFCYGNEVQVIPSIADMWGDP